MATEAFSPYPTFDEREVFDDIGLARPVVKLKPNNFEGPVAHWANDRMRKFGETIISRGVYIEELPNRKTHRVAWVYHEGFGPDNGEPFCIHHIACDCSGDIDRADTIEEKQEIIAECPAIIPAIENQAALVNASYNIDDLLISLSFKPGAAMEEQNPTVQDFLGRSIVYLLERDYREPASWIANVESGWTLMNLMARIYKINSKDLDTVAAKLAEQDEIETDGVHIALSQRQKDLIEVDKRLNSIITEQGIV